jgi:hypothetical protein
MLKIVWKQADWKIIEVGLLSVDFLQKIDLWLLSAFSTTLHAPTRNLTLTTFFEIFRYFAVSYKLAVIYYALKVLSFKSCAEYFYSDFLGKYSRSSFSSDPARHHSLSPSAWLSFLVREIPRMRGYVGRKCSISLSRSDRTFSYLASQPL